MIKKFFEFLEIDNTKNASLQLIDKDGEHNVMCKTIEDVYSIQRILLYHRFRIRKSDSKKYTVGGEFILSSEFDGKEHQFSFYPLYNITGPGLRGQSPMKKLIYKAIIKEN